MYSTHFIHYSMCYEIFAFTFPVIVYVIANNDHPVTVLFSIINVKQTITHTL